MECSAFLGDALVQDGARVTVDDDPGCSAARIALSTVARGHVHLPTLLMLMIAISGVFYWPTSVNRSRMSGLVIDDGVATTKLLSGNLSLSWWKSSDCSSVASSLYLPKTITWISLYSALPCDRNLMRDLLRYDPSIIQFGWLLTAQFIAQWYTTLTNCIGKLGQYRLEGGCSKVEKFWLHYELVSWWPD